MAKPPRARFITLVDLLARRRPDIDPGAINEGRVLVDGRALTNPAARVRADASVRVVTERRLRGDIKLSHALDTFGIEVRESVAVDLGASTGGFTTTLLDRGARRVYAVDAGVGQLLGRLRTDPRVVNLEGCNLAALDGELVADVVDIITMDLSYLSIAGAIGQLDRLTLGAEVDLVALVKPTFELRRATLAATDDDIARALDRATDAATEAGWVVFASCDAPATGQRGAREAFLHARR